MCASNASWQPICIKKKGIQFNHKPAGSYTLPSQLRMIICGPSGAGKTILALKLLIDYLDYDNLIIVSPSLDSQEEYQVFIRGLQNGLRRDQIKEIFRRQDEINIPLIDLVDRVVRRNRISSERIDVTIIKDPLDLPTPEEIGKKYGLKKTIVLVDDCLTKDQSSIKNLFIYGRHSSICCIYLSQSFSELDRSGIRGNADVFVFYEPTNTIDVECIWRNFCKQEYDTAKKFSCFARECFRGKVDKQGRNRGYILIDTSKTKDNKIWSNVF
jgi:hypothetical protein